MDIKILGASENRNSTAISHAILRAVSSQLPQKISSLLSVIKIEFSTEGGIKTVKLSLELGHKGIAIEGAASQNGQDVAINPDRLVILAANKLQRAIREYCDHHQQMANELSELAHSFFSGSGTP